jgi:hypothetical protein
MKYEVGGMKSEVKKPQTINSKLKPIMIRASVFIASSLRRNPFICSAAIELQVPGVSPNFLHHSL